MIVHQSVSRGFRLGLPSLAGFAPDHVSAGLAPHLDDGYHYLRRVSVGSERLESIVVGPGGTWSISTAHEAGRYRKRNGHW